MSKQFMTYMLMGLISMALSACADFSSTTEFEEAREDSLDQGAFVTDNQGDTRKNDGDDGADGESDDDDGKMKDGGGESDDGDDNEFDGGSNNDGGNLTIDDGEAKKSMRSKQEFPLVGFCSDNGTERSGSNIMRESELTVKIYDASSLSIVEEYTEQDVRDEIADHKRASIIFSGLDDGEYVIALCAGAQSCNINHEWMEEYREDPEHLEDATRGLVGVIDRVEYREGSARARGHSYAMINADDDATGSKEHCDIYNSPLIVNLGTSGIELTSQSEGQDFDIDGDDQTERISWIKSPTAAFLVLDRNHNGQIDSVHELFGNKTVGPDGLEASNGFTALAKYDLNMDLVIDANDSIYDELRLWFDRNQDGITDANELHSLSSHSVLSIDLRYVNMLETDVHGNQTRQRSTVWTGSSHHQIVDVWFRSL